MHDQRGNDVAAPHDQVGRLEGLVDGAVRERALVHDPLLGIERLPVGEDELCCVLGGVARVRDHDRDRLARVPGGVDRRRVIGHVGLDPGGERPRERSHVLAREDAHDAGHLERGRDVELADARVRKRRADDRSMPRMRDGVDVVHEAPLAAQERFVLDPRHGLTDEAVRA